MGKNKSKKPSTKTNSCSTNDEKHLENNVSSSKCTEDLTPERINIEEKKSNNESQRGNNKLKMNNSTNGINENKRQEILPSNNSEFCHGTKTDIDNATQQYECDNYGDSNSSSEEPTRLVNNKTPAYNSLHEDIQGSDSDTELSDGYKKLSCSDNEKLNNHNPLICGRSIERSDNDIFNVDNTSSATVTASPSPTPPSSVGCDTKTIKCDSNSTTPKTIEESLAVKSCNQESVEAGVVYSVYKDETILPAIMKLISNDLSEPYSIYTYRYFIHNWPDHCYVVCKYILLELYYQFRVIKRVNSYILIYRKNRDYKLNCTLF